AVFVVFIPAVLDGQNIYVWAIVTSVYIILMTMFIVYGANRKSLAAGLGCFAGTLVAGLLTMIMDAIIHLTGMLNEESLYLTMLNSEIDLKGVIFGAIIIGAIGAIMDVSMSIASALEEISQVTDHPTPALLIRSGLSIGRDIMGTMANTLVLAYIGSGLSVVLLLVAHNGSLLELLNREMIIVEMLQALAGSIGILMTIPLTSLISALLLRRAQNKAVLEQGVLEQAGREKTGEEPRPNLWEIPLEDPDYDPFAPAEKKTGGMNENEPAEPGSAEHKEA
ncbi:MAG: YibE/F family protein, partial [Firmicutes bacterium]|nr:YibE/F family protein [Bacillota bacterium]